MDFLSLLLPEYKQNWEAEYRPYRLQTAIEHWHREYQFWLRVQSRLQQFHAREGKPSTLPSLNTVVGDY